MNQPKTHQIAGAQRGSLTDKIQKNAMRIVQQEEEHIATLVPEASPERRKYPESEFRRHFLPIVSGEAYKKLPPDYTPERLSEESIGYWTQIAGGPGYEVEVVENDGTVAFIMPALMDTSVLNTAQINGQVGLRALNQEYNDKKIGLPHVAARDMENGLSKKLVHLLSGDQDTKSAVNMVKRMREYYGLSIKDSEDKPDVSAINQSFMGNMSFD